MVLKSKIVLTNKLYFIYHSLAKARLKVQKEIANAKSSALQRIDELHLLFAQTPYFRLAAVSSC
jgi:hypothetical protein